MKTALLIAATLLLVPVGDAINRAIRRNALDNPKQGRTQRGRGQDIARRLRREERAIRRAHRDESNSKSRKQ